MAGLASKRPGASFTLPPGYAWESDVIKEEDAHHKELANNAPTILHGRTLVFDMPKPLGWETLKEEQKSQKRREYLCERYGQLCFVFEEDRPQLRNPAGRILIRENQYYALFEAWYAKNLEPQYHATMSLLEHGMKMELQDFLNLHQSLKQDVAYGYGQARLEESGTSHARAHIPFPPNIKTTAVASSTILHDVHVPHKPQNNPMSLNKKGTIGPDVSLDTAFDIARRAFLSRKTTAPSLKRKADGELATVEPKKPKLGNGEEEPAWKARIKLPQEAALNHRVYGHEPHQRAGTPGNQGPQQVNTTHLASAGTQQLLRRDARPFTTIGRSAFGVRLQHQMRALSPSQLSHRQKRLCTIYGQGLKDAREVENRQENDFRRAFRERLGNFCILAARYHDNNGNAYTRTRIAMKLASDIGVDLKTQADLDWAELGNWYHIFCRFMENAVYGIYRRGEAIGRPLDKDVEARFEVFRSLPPVMWPRFCNAMESIEGQIQGRKVF